MGTAQAMSSTTTLKLACGARDMLLPQLAGTDQVIPNSLKMVSWPGLLLPFLICVLIWGQYLWVYFFQMVSQWCLVSNHVITCILFMVKYISVLDSCEGVYLWDQMCLSCTGAFQKSNMKDVMMRILHFIWFPLNVYLNKEEQYSYFCMLKCADSAKMEEKVWFVWL